MATPSEGQKLFCVEEVFQLSGSTLVLLPGLPTGHFDTNGRPYLCQILIKRFDGTSLVTQAAFHVPVHTIKDPELGLRRHVVASEYNCLLKGLSKSEVPIGSEIYEVKAE